MLLRTTRYRFGILISINVTHAPDGSYGARRLDWITEDVERAHVTVSGGEEMEAQAGG